MHNRYNDEEMSYIWSEENKFKTWYHVEKSVSMIHASLGIIPVGVVEKMTKNYDKCFENNFVEKINEIEKLVKHDVIAFLTHLSNEIGEESKFIHYGMTSQDLIDTSLSLQIRDSLTLISKRISDVKDSLKEKALKYKNTFCVGRSHGIHAEPMTFGLKLLTHYEAFSRCENLILKNYNDILRIKCSGAVGTFSMIDPIVEESLAGMYELQPETIATQVVPRERIALMMSLLSIVASCLERFAVEIRHLQRTEVGEVMEGFKPGQKGSSAMPHKKNPILTENLTGLCRAVRMALIPSMENIALWHERDISHSSVERITLPDTFTHLSFALKRTKNIIDDMVINENKMMDNLWITNGLIFSQQILLKLIEKGYTREDAYSVVQKCAHNETNLFAENLNNENIFDLAELTECFDLKKYIKNIDYIYERVLG